MKKEVNFKVVSASEDYAAMLKFNMFGKKAYVPWLMGIATAISAIVVFLQFSGRYDIPTLIYLAALVWVVIFAFTLLSIKKQVSVYSKSASALVGKVMVFDVDETGIKETDEATDANIHISWEHMREAYETGQFFFLYVAHQQCFIIPKLQIGEDASGELSVILAEQLGDKFKKRP